MSITPLYQIPLCQNIENEDLFVKYISSQLWEGELWLNGGWGPKTEVQELTADDPITNFKIPFMVSPINDIDFLNGNKESNKRYHIAFTGENWRVLVNFIEEIKKLGVEEQKYVLNSYFTSKIPEEGKEIYQLCIIVKGDSTTIMIDKGKWIPSFENVITIAGW